MSQIGRMPIIVPENVEIMNNDNNISVKGKLGNLEFKFDSNLDINISDNQVVVSRKSDNKKYRELHGLTRSLINNMIIGVSEGYEKKMTLVGTGYTADASKGTFLLLNVGFSHPVYIQCPEALTVKTPKATEIVITGIDKQLVGQFSARIRQIRKPEPYKGKGIRYSDEVIRKKAGKTVGAK
ncbi:MAG: 50S ribosomal protein L6 [Candidatus Marinimicrobia bacterium]|nr:50S ribosomal protein L6 [Candidatus Neomarinimicrobiota bacterium]|tara:strand:- start:363 stop:908 length:546 start_codon:yes stop_codon:yes gene_type:complete